jgi:subtilase family serine protease
MVFDPPTEEASFSFGSGGGPSGVFPKPFFQHQLPGGTRLLPDVSWLADPFTGVFIAISEPFTVPELSYQIYGGTSVACPMFSALFAIANQEAGVPLGQAAPYLYSMPIGAITDIVPYGSSTNVAGTVTDTAGTTSYPAASLTAPLGRTTNTFFSALWDYPLYPDTTVILTFGTDSGLATAVGWDNVTGVGTPNAQAFADSFRP